MKNITLAFYKSEYGTFLDKFISFFSNGPHSHVEMIFHDENISFSSSPRKGGVDFRFASFVQDGKGTKVDDEIIFINHKWDFIKLQVTDEEYGKIIEFCMLQRDKKYDWVGIFSFIIPIKQDKSRWFCSEIIIAALNHVGRMKSIKQKISPSEMYLKVLSEKK